jgi:putative flippase GtrA
MVLQMRYGPRWWWRAVRSPLGQKLIRYCLGSVVTTIISFAVLSVSYGVLHLWGAVADTVLANVVATVPGYWLNRTWTWGRTGRSDPWREVVPYWVLSLLGIGISMATAELAGSLARSHHLHALAATALVDGANLVAWSGVFVGKYLLFDRMFQSVATAMEGRGTSGSTTAPAPEPVGVGAEASGSEGLVPAGLVVGEPGVEGGLMGELAGEPLLLTAGQREASESVPPSQVAAGGR